ncbi:hypothetical protein F0562_013994 [Nyssa sinensis]|uniref:Homeobox-leucine zipper protein n=1 Tax=Nyssa sinensis TaxID=561372 RepID=A0A5J4ZPX3_9ASTE|nr:hypothetical protein F0562_013994 [Nyssa sinensis]
MDYFQSHTRKHPQKCNKKRLSQDQVRLLETSFYFNNKLDPDRKLQLSQELGLPPRQVAIWLEREVERLKEELGKAQEMLLSLSTPYSSLSTASCDEVGSSSLLGDSKHYLDKELYACLIGVEGQYGKAIGHEFFAPSTS